MDNKPKMDFLLNVPTIVVLGNNFKNGTGQYGPWFGWGVTNDGVEKTMFADADLQAKIAPFGRGAQLAITKSQIPGTRQFAWAVAPAGQAAPVAQPAAAPYAPPPALTYHPTQPAQPNGNERTREDYRQERIARAEEAITDAATALKAQAIDENVRALAISFLIDEQRQGIAPPPDEPF